MIAVRSLSKSFTTDRGKIDVLKDVDLDIRAGERIAVVGASGAGILNPLPPGRSIVDL